MTERDFRAHVIQLCDYIEDGINHRDIPLNIGAWDLGVVRKKSQQVREFAFYGAGGKDGWKLDIRHRNERLTAGPDEGALPRL